MARTDSEYDLGLLTPPEPGGLIILAYLRKLRDGDVCQAT